MSRISNFINSFSLNMNKVYKKNMDNFKKKRAKASELKEKEENKIHSFSQATNKKYSMSISSFQLKKAQKLRKTLSGISKARWKLNLQDNLKRALDYRSKNYFNRDVNFYKGKRG